MSIKRDIESCFGEIEDPRKRHSPPHKLIEVLIIALSAIICGADNWVAVAEFGKAKEGWLKEKLGLKLTYGIPSHDTFGRIFGAIDPEKFGECFIKWVKNISEIEEGEVVNIDGKQVKRSYDKWSGKKAIHMVSAWANEAGLVLGQCKTEEKTNEIKAIPALLELLVLKGCIVTIDAMGCQTEIVKQIVAQEADYTIALKKNQGNLYQEVVYTFEEGLRTDFRGISFDFNETIEKGHGRLEIRRCWTINDPDIIAYLNPTGKWVNLNCIVMIEAERRIGTKVSLEKRYYISSLSGQALLLNQVVRSHWGIENKLHWVLDVAFGEDHCRVRRDNAPQNLAILRQIALNLIRQDSSSGGVQTKRLKAAWNSDFLFDILLNFT